MVVVRLVPHTDLIQVSFTFNLFNHVSDQAEFIFRNFFGGSGGFGGFDDDDGGFPFRMGGMGMGGMGMGGMPGMSGMGGRTKQKQGPPPPQKAEIATMPLTVTLEELYAGKVRKLKVTRTRWKSKTESYREEKLVEINVKPGWKDGTKITFNGEGDQDAFNALPGDLCFVIQTKEHSRFKRVDGDLHMTVQLPLLKALTGCKVPITTLDGRQIIVDLDSEVIQPDSTKRVSNEGMPGKNGKGDLILNFKVVFPRHLTQEQKEGIAKILPNA